MTPAARRTSLALVLVTALTLGACGDDPDSGSGRSTRSTGTAADQDSAAVPAREGATASQPTADEYPGVYAAAEEICGTGSRARVARNVHASSTRPRDVARAFANGYRPRLRGAAFRGCLAGLN
jgi:hypothetical protein